MAERPNSWSRWTRTRKEVPVNKRQAERVEAQKLRSARAIKRIEDSNAKAKKRRETAQSAHDEWRKNKSVDPMVPYVRDGDVDSRPVVNEGPPVRRAYFHTYGWTRAERRVAESVLKSLRRRRERAGRKLLFAQIWESQRSHNEAA